MYDVVSGAQWTTLAPVSRFCPAPANVTPVNSILEPLPLRILIGYRYPTCEPNEPETHSTAPPSSTMARLVLRLYIFLDQFSIVEYLSLAFFLTKSSTHPAWRLATLYFGAEQPSMKWRLAPSSTIISVCSNCPAPLALSLKYDWSGMETWTPLGTYTNEPPDHTAPWSAANLWSRGVTSFMKYSWTISAYSPLRALSISVYTTPWAATSSLTLWYTSSESYCAPTPARDARSACGIPSLSNVSLISSGTSFQSPCILVLGLTYVAMWSISSPSIEGPQSGTGISLYTFNALSRNSVIHCGSFFSSDIFLTISSVRPSSSLKASFSTSLIS